MTRFIVQSGGIETLVLEKLDPLVLMSLPDHLQKPAGSDEVLFRLSFLCGSEVLDPVQSRFKQISF